MAVVRSANTFYIDATGSLAVKNIKVTHIIVSATSAGGILVLKDVTTGNTKFDIRVASDETTQVLDFSLNPVLFPNGIDATTVTNCVATCLISESRG